MLPANAKPQQVAFALYAVQSGVVTAFDQSTLSDLVLPSVIPTKDKTNPKNSQFKPI